MCKQSLKAKRDAVHITLNVHLLNSNVLRVMSNGCSVTLHLQAQFDKAMYTVYVKFVLRVRHLSENKSCLTLKIQKPEHHAVTLIFTH